MATRLQNFPGKGKKRSPRIEIIPMVDVMFLLLVFYILSSLAMQKQRGIAVQLPGAKSGVASSVQDNLVLSVSAEGLYYVNKDKVSADQLADAIHRWALVQPGGPEKAQEQDVILQVDRKAEHRFVIRAMDELRLQRLTRLVLSTKPGVQGDD